MSFVLDASVTLSWCLPDEAQTSVSTAARKALSTDIAIVPPLWLLEIGNTLAVAERRGRIKKGSALPLLADILALPIEVVGVTGSLDAYSTKILTLALIHQISTYDATYLVLALEKGLSLATEDKPLTAAAANVGVPLLGMNG